MRESAKADDVGHRLSLHQTMRESAMEDIACSQRIDCIDFETGHMGNRLISTFRPIAAICASRDRCENIIAVAENTDTFTQIRGARDADCSGFRRNDMGCKR